MSKRRLQISIVSAATIVVLGILMIVSVSFAWLDVSRIPFISDLTLSVITDNDLVIAHDESGVPGEWSTYLDASEYFQGMAPLKPVTYQNGGFYKLLYDEHGRTAGVTQITEGDINAPGLTAVHSSVAKVVAEEPGYIMALDFWLKTNGANAEVWLKEPKEIEDGEINRGTYAVGSPQWSDAEVQHINSGYGAETTIRMGFDIKKTDAEGNFTGEDDFFIYEPNADIHPGRENGYESTPAIDGGVQISDDHHIVQYASSWDDVTPAKADYVVYKSGEFMQNYKLLDLHNSEMAKVRLWIWLEGQDADCRAITYADAVAILGNVEFGVKDSGHNTGIERRTDAED